MKNKIGIFKKLFSFAIVCAVILSFPVIAKADNGNKGSADLKIDYHTKSEIADFIRSHPTDKAYTNSFSSTPSTNAPYAAGRLSDDVLKDSLNRLNAYRYIAGVPSNVTLNESYNELAQAASLVNAVNGTLSHYPSQPSDMSNDLYDAGYKGAGKSNIAAGMSSIGYSLDHGWMSDSDSGNIDRVGHRRWVINPKMSQVGFGLV
ncbi:MAG: CAP domain-containing protein, partial [Lachnospiraceae bacterium]|nr:CAP domain-containing protein [Lachnospiraceae bacterium]